MITKHRPQLEESSVSDNIVHNTIEKILDFILQTLNSLQKAPNIYNSTPIKLDLIDLKNSLLALRPLESWGFVFSDPLESEENESLDYFIPRLSAHADQESYQHFSNMASYVIRAVADLKQDLFDILRETLLLINYLQDIIEMIIPECQAKTQDNQKFQKNSLIYSEYQDKIKGWWCVSFYERFQLNFVQPEKKGNYQYVQVLRSKGNLPEITLKLEKLLEKSIKRLSLIGQLHPTNTDDFIDVHSFLHNARCHYNSILHPIGHLNKALVLYSSQLTSVQQNQKEGGKNENAGLLGEGRRLDHFKQKAVPTFGMADQFAQVLRGNATVTKKSSARNLTHSSQSDEKEEPATLSKRGAPRQFGSLGRNAHLKLDLSTVSSSAQSTSPRKSASLSKNSKLAQAFFGASQQPDASSGEFTPNSPPRRAATAKARGSIPLDKVFGRDAESDQKVFSESTAQGSSALTRNRDAFEKK